MRPQGVAGFQADLNLVRDGFQRFGLLDERVRFLQGPLESTLPDAPIGRLSLIRLGHGLAGEVRAALDNLYDKLAPGGFVIVDDHNEPACRKDIKTFRAERKVTAPLERIDGSTVAWRKAAADKRGRATSAPAGRCRARAPLAPPAPQDALDLSVVIVMYNMRREAARALHALSRAYQEGIDDVAYEVVVVENGSDDDQRLGAGFRRELRARIPICRPRVGRQAVTRRGPQSWHRAWHTATHSR